MPIGDLLAQITGEPSPTTTAFPPLPKRKADDDPRRPSDKMQRAEIQAANSSRPLIPPNKPSIMETTKPQNGGRPSNSNSASSILKNGQSTPPHSAGPPKPPKKGSYAEIIARAQAQQASRGPVGKIQHKAIEKLPSKREREATKAKKTKSIQSGLAPGSKFQKLNKTIVSDGKNGTKQTNSKVPKEPEKKVKKAALATTGYSGTARPRPGSQAASKSGPARPLSGDRDRYRKDRSGSRYDSYMGTDEEEDDVEEDDELDYESDGSSDMEAAVFEVDEEEELAARIARREDAEALAEENRLKKEKEEKKRRLQAMAKKAPGQRY